MATDRPVDDGEIDRRIAVLRAKLSRAQHSTADVEEQIRLMVHLGNAFHDKGDMQKAFSWRGAAFNELRGYCGESRDELVMLVHGDLARSHLEAHRFAEAEQDSRLALAMAESLHNEKAVIIHLINLHAAHFGAGHAAEADRLVDMIWPRAKELDDPYVLGLLTANLALQASFTGHLNSAQHLARQSLYWANDLEHDDPVAANQLRRIARAAIASSYHAAAVITGRDEYFEAADRFAPDGDDDAARLTAQREADRARLEVLAGRYTRASSHSDRAVAALEKVRSSLGYPHMQLSFFDSPRQVYDTAIELQARLGETERAFHTAEQARSRLILARLQALPARVNAWPDQAQRELTGVLDQYGAAQTDEDPISGDAATERFLKLYRDHVDERPQWTQWRSPAPAEAADVQQNLAPTEALISYYITEQSTIIFAVTREGSHFQHIALPEEKLAGYVNKLLAITAELAAEYDSDENAEELDAHWETRQDPNEPWPQCLAGPLTALNRQLERLYTILIVPVLPVINDKQHWVIVPHGPLHHVPWPALRDNGRHLIQDRLLSFQPSASMAVAAAHRDTYRAAPSGPPLLMADSVSLTRAHAEATAAQAALPDAQTHLGENATSSVFFEEAPNARMLHLICHHQVDGKVPGLSHFRLAGGRGSDYLYAFHLNDLRLAAELVVLSCCASGHATVMAGDEQFGMVQAFLACGARSTVATLWDVYDESSAEFFRLFYLRSRHEPVVTAVAEVQRDLIEHPQLCLPQFWAPYLLFGRGDVAIAADARPQREKE